MLSELQKRELKKIENEAMSLVSHSGGDVSIREAIKGKTLNLVLNQEEAEWLLDRVSAREKLAE